MIKTKCTFCKKKTGIISYDCRCGNKYCSKCKFPETHNCTFDYIKDGKEELTKKLIKVENDKIITI